MGSTVRYKIFCLLLLLFQPAVAGEAGPARQARHPALALNGVDVMAAIGKESSAKPPSAPPLSAQADVRITGIGTPHHLLAADLIARAFLATRGNRYDRVIVLGPDHFFRSPRPAATTLRGFETPHGPVETDAAAAAALLQDSAHFARSDLFDSEHGITGLMPFVRLVLPDVPVVAVALGIGSSRAEWDRITETLKTIVTPHTLVVQSTDYSHYLLPHLARMHDQQTLNVLAAGDLEALARLNQPAHLDSRAANYIQLRLQKEVFAAAPVVIANRTGFDYMPLAEPTTSYIVTAYGPDAAALARLRYADQQVHYFGGDVFIGRHFTELAAKAPVRDHLVAMVKAITQGAPLTLNLEGAMLPEVPHGLPPQRHAMLASLAMPFLGGLSTVAAGMANNHSHDLGKVGLEETARALERAGIAPLRHLQPVDMGAFRLVAINYIGLGDHKAYPAARPPNERPSPDLVPLCRQAVKPPLIALLHWGEEYRDTPGETEIAIARDLHRCGVAAIIGAHSHKAAAQPLLTGGGDQLSVYSVGNLLFDQFSTTSSGALAEVRFFGRGTFALRMIPMPNLYEAGLAMRAAPREGQR